MTDILIHGINGRMGKEVYCAALATQKVNVVCGVDKHALGDFNCPVYPSLAEVNCHVDAIIDFSSPSALDDLLGFARDYGCALVLATTGYGEEQVQKIRECAKLVPICLTANTSLGICAFKRAIAAVKDCLSDFDVSLTELHRRGKKDAPSGTALMLKSTLKRSVQIHPIRCGDEIGTHELTFYGNGETFTIRHTVTSRRVFAIGAIEACIKTARLSPSLYGIDGEILP